MPDEFTFKAEWDEGRWIDLFITGEDEPSRYCREDGRTGTTEISLKLDRDEAEQLWRQLDSTIGEYVRERERERAAYERATPAQRARVLGVDVDPVELVEGYALDDPKRITMMEQADEPRSPLVVQWLRPGDPQDETLMYRWTKRFTDGRVGGRLEVVRRIDGPGSTWGPGETIFTGWSLDTCREVTVKRGFTDEQVVRWDD